MFTHLIQNSRILLVDDSYDTLSYLGSIFSENNFKILLAHNGTQAIAIANAKSPDIILLDINMPDINGYEVCKILKSEENTMNIPVIFLTGNVDTDDIIKGFEAGAVDYIIKPYSKDELLTRVSTHLKIVKMQEHLLKNQEMLHLKEMEIMQKEKQRIEFELEQSKKEISSIALQITKTDNLISDLIDKIIDEVKDTSLNSVDKITKIIQSFKFNLEKDNWEEIETRFVKIHQDFFDKLLKQYPDLTKNELKLCAFLRLSLSTKEICSITLQSEDAIKKARYRLRQKLNAPNDAILSNLILSL